MRSSGSASQGQLPSFLENTRYVLGLIWHEESNRKQRFKRLLLFFGWQFWKRAVRKPIEALTPTARRLPL